MKHENIKFTFEAKGRVSFQFSYAICHNVTMGGGIYNDSLKVKEIIDVLYLFNYGWKTII